MLHIVPDMVLHLMLPHVLQKFKYLDSVDPEGTDPFSYRSMLDPEKGESGYPRLQVWLWPSAKPSGPCHTCLQESCLGLVG